VATAKSKKKKPVVAGSAILPKTVKSPVKEYTQNAGRGGRRTGLMWESSEWDLAETKRILDTESIFRQVCDKKRNLFIKEGYEFVSNNLDRVAYIEKRLQQMEFATGTPFPTLLSEIIYSLIISSNAFLVKARNFSASGGKRRVDHNGKHLEPIAGYFILPAETVRFARDEYGKVIKYRQVVQGKEPKEFRPEDVVHFYWNKRKGFSVGTPDIVPVKDDIRALRRIEENVELLVYQHLFPLFHYKVGTDDAPAAVYPDGTTEVEAVQAAVAAIPADGCWVTPERHEIKAVGAEGKALAVEKTIEHFKSRIYVGLGVSPIDLGEAGDASRSTAQTVSQNLIDNTKAYQKQFGAQFYHFIIQELLLESAFSPNTLLDKDNKVFLKFAEIDTETRIARENHYAEMFNQNAVTHGELRQALGKEPMTDEEWKDTHWMKIKREEVILQSIDEPGTPESKAVSRAAAARSKSSSGGSVANKNQPKNQHGTRIAPKLNKDIQRVLNKILVSEDALSVLIDTLVLSTKHFGLEKDKVKEQFDFISRQAGDSLANRIQRLYRKTIKPYDPLSSRLDLREKDKEIEQSVSFCLSLLFRDFFQAIERNTIGTEDSKIEDGTYIKVIGEVVKKRILRTVEDLVYEIFEVDRHDFTE